MSRKTLTIGAAAFLILAAFLTWLFIASSKPLPGQKIADLGRGHVPIGTKVDYNSNPPTSGPHYGDWVRAGIYSDPKDDGNLVHSLEHGYIIMSYKCDQGNKVNKGMEASASGEASSSGNLKDCQERKNQLEQIYNKKGQRKLIVVPRSNLDTFFALTAWNYLDKFNEFDERRVTKFIDAHRDHGPEKTME